MSRGVVWTGLTRCVAVVGAGAVAGAAVLSGTAYAGTAPGPKPSKLQALLDQWGDPGVDHLAVDGKGIYQPAADPGSLYTVTQAVGARGPWGTRDARGRAVTGQGVTVGVLDSGVEPVAGLGGAGKLVLGPDLSLETNSDSLRGHDTFGHGTHLASIIAGRDPVAGDSSGGLKDAKPGDQLGIAPGAQVLAVKASTADGSSDVSEVVAGLDWIVQHRTDNGMNVRVVNLSFGTDSTQAYQVDPLSAAVENAWRHGVVVVVSAGNEGNDAGRLTDPAMDPYVVAVGASDPSLTVGGWKNPSVATFSNGGSATRGPDLVAPGTSIAGLRDPGSYVDTEHPEGLVPGDASGRLFRGSGTSQAAAVVSGTVALLAQAFPTATPDQLKAALTATAHPLFGTPASLQGAGELDAGAAAGWLRMMLGGPRPGPLQLAALSAAVQRFPASTGSGSLEAARGGSHLVDPVSGDVLSGEVDVQGQAWDPQAWQQAEQSDSAWSGGAWLGVQYTGGDWADSQDWSSARWSAARWSGAQWTDADWSASDWSSARWSSARWSSARWSSARWSGDEWG